LATESDLVAPAPAPAQVFVVGHDLGAQVAWHLCLLRPDRVRAVVVLGVPYFPRAPRPTTEIFAALDDGFYITQFQVSVVILAIIACCVLCLKLKCMSCVKWKFLQLQGLDK
jgi:pimeloyl-ACP methyl ester carboxylesterase